MPAVRIILADRGWILERIATELAERLPWVEIGERVAADAAVHYYINYSAWRGRGPTRDVAFFTHVEEVAPEAVARFFEVAKQVEQRVCMSRLYADTLRERGLSQVHVIRPGVDLARFQPRLRLGVAGRRYPTGRKGEALLREIADLDFVEFHTNGGDWPVRSIDHADEQEFFGSIDYLLVPARYEGGPMPVLEALAAGIPVISPEIGFVRELPHVSYRNSDAADLRRVLRELYAPRQALRESVQDSSWDRFAQAHERLFDEMGVAPRQRVFAPSDSAASAPRADGMRILLVSRSDPNGGGPSYRIPRTAEALRRRGHRVELSSDPTPDARGFDLAHVFNIWEPADARRQLAAIRAQGVPVLFSPIFMDLLEHYAAENLVIPLFSAGLDAAAREVLANLPNDLAGWVGEARKREIHPLQEHVDGLRRCIELSGAIAVLGRAELDALRALLPDLPPVCTIPNAPVVEPREPTALPPGLSRNGYLLCAGRLERRKNQLLLIEALRGSGIPLVLIGARSDLEYAQLCEIAAKDLPVHFLEHLAVEEPEFVTLLSGAAAFVLPSWIEGAPISALDAASLGTRLVLSDRGCVREYFGPHARYFDPASLSEMRARVLETWQDAQRAPGPDEALRRHVSEKLGWDRVIDATEAAYRRVLGRETPATVAAAEPASERSLARDGAPRRLEIGSGTEPQPGYEHLDSRPGLPELDHLHDMLEPLPFPDESFVEVMSRSCVEHIPWRRTAAVLRDWVRVLRPGGELRLYLPDLEYIARQYVTGRDDEHLAAQYREDAQALLGGYSHRSWALIKLFAGQEYPQNFHYAAFDFESLSGLLRMLGLFEIERIAPPYALHVVARKPRR